MRRLLAVLALFGLALAWRVAEGPRVDVLYAPGQEVLAEAVVRRAEAALDALAPYLGAPEERLTLRLDPGTDFFNGYANVFPRPGTTLFPAFPYYRGSFLNTADPLYTLVLHELVHLLHLRGPRNGLGLVPEGAGRPYPLWLTEGLAAYLESMGGGGRLHDAYTRGLLRALAGDPPPLALAGVAPYPRFPYGDLRYRVGVAFVGFLVRRHGWDTLKASFDAYQRVPMPFSMFLPDGYAEAWRQASGTRLEDEWRAFWKEQAADRPPPPEGLGPRGRSPALGGGGLAYLDEDRLVVGGRVHRNPLNRTIGRLTWLGPRALVYDRLEAEPDGAYLRRLYALDPETGRETPLPGTDHAFYPAAYRGTLYFVREGRAGSELVAWRAGRAEPRYRAPAGDHLVGVAAGAGGLAFLLWHRGAVRPYLLTDRGARALPGHGRVLIDLAWAGKTLLFASDAEGVYKIYALDPASGRLWRWLDAPYGAFAPVLEGDRLRYVALTASGFRLARARPRPVPVHPRPAPPLSAPRLARPLVVHRDDRPYASLGPVGWTPLAPLGAAVFGEDRAGETGWTLAGAWVPGSGALAFVLVHVPRFGQAPERYRLELHADPDLFYLLAGYRRDGLWQGKRWTLSATLGTARAGRWFPLAEAGLALGETHAYGRDRVWGEAGEGWGLDLVAGLAGRPYGRAGATILAPSGLTLGAEAGLDDPGFWLGPGARAAVWAGYRAVLPLDLTAGDGLFYLSHLEFRPRVGLTEGPAPGYGVGLGVAACLAYRYALTACPGVWVGYRPDRGLAVGLNP